MPKVFEPKDLPVVEQDGAKIATLADREMLGTDALQVERILLKANAKSSAHEPTNVERFVYVIQGSGQANVGNETFSLEVESVLWFDKQDRFSLQASAHGLEVLLCQAPAME